MPLRRTALLAVSLPLLLTACGGPPSKSQAQAAMTRHLESALGQPGAVQRFDDFGVAGCKEDQASDGYRCDVSGQVVLSVMGTELRRPLGGAVRFSKASGEWTVYRATP